LDGTIILGTVYSMELDQEGLVETIAQYRMDPKMANNVRRALHKVVFHRPLALVMAPGTESGAREKWHQKVELEKACLEEVSRQFTQARDTPMLAPPLIDIFGECGNLKDVAKVLNDNFSPPNNCDPFAAKFPGGSFPT